MDYDAIIQSFPLELQPSMGQLVEALRTELGPDWSQVTHGLDQVRAAITDLSAAQLRTEARVAEMGERIVELGAAQLRTEARVAELGAAQLRTEGELAQLAAAQRKSEDRLDRLEETVAELVKSVTELRLAVEGLLAHQRSMQDLIAKHDGMFLEMKYRERPYSYFGKVLRRAKHVPFDQIEADLELKLSDADLEEITLLDVLIRGRPKRDSSDE
jgi:chromosome segregation ATPase